ncbi:MAG: histidine kinase [Betaproteobacteria bacterium]|nr:histidine kinase [Betaproteobacteria bacterium]
MGRLFWKFFFFIWLAQLTTVLGVSALVWVKIRAQEERSLEVSQSPPAAFAVGAAAATLQFGGPEALKGFLQSRERRPYGVLVVDEGNRELLERDVPATALEQARTMAAQRAGDDEPPRGVREVRAADGHTYLLFQPGPGSREGARGGGPDMGGGGPPGGRRSMLMREWRLFPLEPLIGGVLASFVFASLLALYIARPIKSLRGAFAAAAAGKLETRVGPAIGNRRDELADLGRDFDHMAGRLQDVIGAQRRLLHDVSHEMRSPLARMQAAIGLARQNEAGGAAPKAEKLAAAIERVERETARIDALVEELLTLSRLDAGVAGVAGGALEEVNAVELLADIVADARFEAQANERDVLFDAGAEGMVRGTAELLHRAFENVIRNAVKYTAPGSSVQVSTRFGGAGELLVLVQDAGPGVPADELQSIFTPFFRGSNGAGSEGHGLGLAIARRVVEAHGGSIRAGNGEQGGLRVEIVLPLAGAGAA